MALQMAATSASDSSRSRALGGAPITLLILMLLAGFDSIRSRSIAQLRQRRSTDSVPIAADLPDRSAMPPISEMTSRRWIAASCLAPRAGISSRSRYDLYILQLAGAIS